MLPRDEAALALLQLPHSGRIRPNLVPRIGDYVMSRDQYFALIITFVGSFIIGCLI